MSEAYHRRRTTLTTLLAAAITVFIAWFWYDSMQARERTLAACRRACRRIDAQLLDETVTIDHMRLARRQGQLVIARRYRFEFSLAGDDRRTGWVHLLGAHITDLQMEYPEGLVMESVPPPD